MSNVEALHIAKADDCAEVARRLREYAARAEAGEFIAFSLILVAPGGEFMTGGHHGKDVNNAELIGYHFSAMIDLDRGMQPGTEDKE